MLPHTLPASDSSVFRVRANSVLDLNSPGNCIGLGKLFLKLITPIFGFPVAQKICSTIPDGVNFRQVLVGLCFPRIIRVPALVFFRFPSSPHKAINGRGSFHSQWFLQIKSLIFMLKSL